MISKRKISLHHQKKTIDLSLLGLVIFFCFFGLLMIYDASSVSALKDFNDKYYYLKEQAKWFVIGVFALLVASNINYKKLYYLSIPILTGVIILLLMVFIPGLGISAYGAKRWINFGLFVIQPAELTKISIIIYLAAWFSNKEKGRFIAFLVLIGLITGLVLMEPDLGTAMIIGVICIAMYFLSQAPIYQFLLLIPAALLAVIFAAITSPYRLKRLTTFFDPGKDPLGASYHIRQILLSLGSGGFFGLGIGKSRQKYAYLPEATTDSIFAIIGEEIGFMGALIFIIIFLYLLYRCYKIGLKAPDKFAYLLAMGITVWLGVQALINLSAMTAILPLTGVPLPFISYGGSGLVVSLMSIGILINISKNSLIKK